jgi:hypothetical protein
MKFRNFSRYVVLASLLFAWSAKAQEKIDKEVEIRKNIKVVQQVVPANVPEDIVKQYSNFLPVFVEALKDNTKDESDECALILKVSAGMKEVGSAKIKRPQANITAYRRNSKQEYVGSFLLYSYTTNGPVNKDETAQFLKRQILDPSECSK